MDELVDAIARLAPTYGGINLEDISAPRCFEIERRLQERLDIPVFHDDQHGTAIVVLAAPEQRRAVVGRPLTVAAGRRVRRRRGRRGDHPDPARGAGVRDVVVCDSRGIIDAARADLAEHKHRLAATTNPRGLCTARSGEALAGADVFVGVSGGTVPEEDVAAMARGQHRLRPGQPRPRGAPGRGRPARRGRRHRALRLPQPDQQRAGLPGDLPRGAGLRARPASPRR